MIKAHQLDLESQLLGFPVVRLSGCESAEMLEACLSYLATNFDKAYAYTEVNATNLPLIHQLESHGFVFSEFRVHLSMQTDDFDDYTKAFYPYVADFITEQEHLYTALQWLSQAPVDDRFGSDPIIPAGFTLARNKANLEKSFRNFPSEWLVGMFNAQTEKLEGFWSMGMTGRNRARLYLHAVKGNQNKLLSSLDALVFSLLKTKGIRWIDAISTGFNISEINRLTMGSGFKVSNATVILRKLVS